MKRLGSFFISKNKFVIKIDDEDILKQTDVVYFFTGDAEILRIGSSRKNLGARIKAWERDVTNALNGKKSPTPHDEAQKWKKICKTKKVREIWVRKSKTIKTEVGSFSVCLPEEYFLIKKYKPSLNRSYR